MKRGSAAASLRRITPWRISPSKEKGDHRTNTQWEFPDPLKDRTRSGKQN